MIKSNNMIKCLFILISIGNIICETSGPCDGWLPFEDEKCFKVISEFTNNFEAQNVCQQNGGKLAVIRTEEEQNLVNHYLETDKIVNSPWIGLKRINETFEWSDKTEPKYTNWVRGRPLNSTDMDCVVISVDLIRDFHTKSENFGKWLDVNCNKKSVVLCERIQPWSIPKIQKVLMETRRNCTDELEILKTQTVPGQQALINSQQIQLTSQKKELDTLKSNPVPIGFIYVQLSGQSEPKTLWPNTEWENVTPGYAGYFFRAEGGQSLPFGQAQEQLTQSLEIKSGSVGIDGVNGYTHGPLKIISDYQIPLYSGSNSGGYYYGIQIKHNIEEIRPLNQAVRIWQRIE